jgi:hypothetical protein
MAQLTVTGEAAAIAAVRVGGAFARQLFRLPVEPDLLGVNINGDTVLYRRATTAATELVLFDVRSRKERQRFDLPRFDALHVSRGWKLGDQRETGSDGGPCSLHFLDPAHKVVATVELAAAPSSVSAGGHHWYVAAHDGRLSCFSHHGRLLWTSDVLAGMALPDGTGALGRTLVASGSGLACLSRGAWLAAYGHEGSMRWKRHLPLVEQAEDGAGDCNELGVMPGASREVVKRAFRRQALTTHPDRNPGALDATQRFQGILNAYERLLSQPASPGAGIGNGRSTGTPQAAASLYAVGTTVVVLSSDGSMTFVDKEGTARRGPVLAGSSVLAAFDRRGALRAAVRDDLLSVFEHDGAETAVALGERPARIRLWGPDVVVQFATSIDVYGTTGRLNWSIQFSDPLRDVSLSRGRIACAAGAVFAFEKARP